MTAATLSRAAAESLARLAPLALGLFWLWTGAVKLADAQGFADILAAHGVLRGPPWLAASAAWAVPAAEVLLGLAILLLGLRPRAIAATCGLGIVWLTMLTGYIFLIAPETLRAVGCGCAGGARPTDGLPGPAALALRNGLLIAAHALAAGLAFCFPPRRRAPQDAAPAVVQTA